ncbi:hypothetical protein GCM10010218_26940 [Streptomyces mashuensis]|uniref:Uncharacterized protein n=1 Tax=Streptomyces mashuensis TaxID=33904 RepID=A0A919B2S5_9ACTN|nr:hypothetical protein [Streptomyces mashuensis]GHF44233.1 hypothetical protein GCM10010218_26940 [Streptomyces mashuensis]
MSKERKPQDPAEWRELLRTPYDYPDEIEEVGKRSLRRRARKIYRQDKKVEVKRRLAEERRREPVTAGGAIVVIAGFLLLGAAVQHWWPEDERPPAKVVRAGGGPDAQSEKADAKGPGTPGASAAPSPSPSASVAVPVDLGKPETAAEGWAKVYWARNPPVDKSHRAVVKRAAPWMTPALAENLAQFDDPAWNELVSNGGVSTVDHVTVGPADDDRVRSQADTPARVWRRVTVETTVAGYRTYNEKKVLLTEITRGGAGWRVGRILGV